MNHPDNRAGDFVSHDGRPVKRLVVGLAQVWFCEPKEGGCGLFMFFKPEIEHPSSACPNCWSEGKQTWHAIEDELAAIEVWKL